MTDYDNVNMDALCRGEDILPRSARKKLMCYYSSKIHPFYIIRPIKVRRVCKRGSRSRIKKYDTKRYIKNLQYNLVYNLGRSCT